MNIRELMNPSVPLPSVDVHRRSLADKLDALALAIERVRATLSGDADIDSHADFWMRHLLIGMPGREHLDDGKLELSALGIRRAAAYVREGKWAQAVEADTCPF